jgi:hypothetical protein
MRQPGREAFQRAVQAQAALLQQHDGRRRGLGHGAGRQQGQHGA